MFKRFIVLATLSLSATLPSVVLGAPNPVAEAAPAPAMGNGLAPGVKLHKRMAHLPSFENSLNARHERGGRRRGRGRKTRRQSRTCNPPSTTLSEGQASTTTDAAVEGEASTPVDTPPAETPAPEPTTSEEQSSPAPTTPSPSSPPAETNQPTNSNPDIQTYLDKHNNERADHGASALTWSDELASIAQNWANQCQWKHSGTGGVGENLSTGSSLDPAGAVQLWLDEEPDYNPSNPQYSHWTQVVWKNTKQVGCAVATCSGQSMFGTNAYGDAKFYVCNYSPPGNVIGQFAENVQK
ncbi:PR-1-like protein [Serendipita vermifera]|nr:PR-1-like protein [Serendipita vermifera]